MGNGRIVKTHWYRRRWEVLARDNFTCRYCGQYAPNVRLEVDHVIPWLEGGTDELDNLVTSCWACNQGKEGYRAHLAAANRRMNPVKQPKRVHVGPSKIGRVRVGPTKTERLIQVLTEHGNMPARELAALIDATPATARMLRARLRKIGRFPEPGV